MTPVVIVTVVGLLLGGAYTAVVWKRARTELWGWFHNVTATLLSVLLGIAAGFWVYRQQQKAADAKELSTLRTLLQREFSDMHAVLTGPDMVTLSLPAGGGERQVIAAYVQPLAIEKAASSGQFSALDTTYLLHLAEAVRAYNVSVQLLFATLNGSRVDPEYPYRIRFAVENLEKQRAGVTHEIERLSHLFRLPLVGYE
jgi:hypothetical protein